MKFRLVENIDLHQQLVSKNLITDLKSKFGDDFDSQPICNKVTEYICKTHNIEEYGAQKLDFNFYAFVYDEKTEELEPISTNGHCVILYNGKIYDYTSNQYPQLEKINYCPRILTRNPKMKSKIEELTGMKCDEVFTAGNYIVLL